MDMEEIRNRELRDNEKLKGAIRTILQEIGEDPDREGLERTPFRWAKAAEEWFGGYGKTAKNVLNRQFTETSDLIIEGPIQFFSHCEHHCTPFYGHVWIGYIPNKQVTGLDKMVKLVEIFARRLSIQERLTGQIADGMVEGLDCKGAMVVVKAYHLCVSSRETKNQTTFTVTSAVRGVFCDDVTLRNEYLTLINMK